MLKDDMIKLLQEYNVNVSPGGAISKQSKPEFIAKHKEEHRKAVERLKFALYGTIVN